jgi:hypothetical protein
VVRVGNLKSGSVGSVGSAQLLPAIRDLDSRPPKTYLLKLGRNYPECLGNLRVLDKHEMAAHEAAMRGIGTLTWRPSEAISELVGTRRCGFVGVRREANIC